MDDQAEGLLEYASGQLKGLSQPPAASGIRGGRFSQNRRARK